MCPDTSVICGITGRCGCWICVTVLAYQTGEGGVLVIVLPTNFDHSRKMLPDIRILFDNPVIMTYEYSKAVECN
jgi:hypothetical protein